MNSVTFSHLQKNYWSMLKSVFPVWYDQYIQETPRGSSELPGHSAPVDTAGHPPYIDNAPLGILGPPRHLDTPPAGIRGQPARMESAPPVGFHEQDTPRADSPPASTFRPTPRTPRGLLSVPQVYCDIAVETQWCGKYLINEVIYFNIRIYLKKYITYYCTKMYVK